MKEIGGFLDIELRGKDCYHSNAIALNTGRNAIRLFIRNTKFKKILIPYFTCDAVYNALLKENIEIQFYHIDENLLPVDLPTKVNGDILIIYNHYWGINGQNVEYMIEKYKGNILIDAAQAFFFIPPEEIPSINSARKFIGVPDGAYLYGCNYSLTLEEGTSNRRMNHLLERYELGAQVAYKTFQYNEKALDDVGIKRMSKLTQGILGIADYQKIKGTRLENFQLLHKKLKDINKLDIGRLISKDDIPLSYPLWSNKGLKQKLIKHKIFVPTYWPNVKEWCQNKLENDFAENIINLPCDQRYDKLDMEHIIELI